MPGNRRTVTAVRATRSLQTICSHSYFALAYQFSGRADVWSVTSYNELRREALATERWNRLHPASEPKRAFIAQVLDGAAGPIVAASDYMKAVPDQIAPWLATGRLISLGTDGFGRSENRQHLREFFEISAEAIVQSALSALARSGAISASRAEGAIAELGFHPEKRDPARA